MIPSMRPAKDENSLGQSVLPEAISLCNYLMSSLICASVSS